jgi:hypothetical protein
MRRRLGWVLGFGSGSARVYAVARCAAGVAPLGWTASVSGSGSVHARGAARLAQSGALRKLAQSGALGKLAWMGRANRVRLGAYSCAAGAQRGSRG